MYDSISNLVRSWRGQILGRRQRRGRIRRRRRRSIRRMAQTSGGPYPALWWEERGACLASLSPGLETTMDRSLDTRH
jgi:hypothetical protein